MEIVTYDKYLPELNAEFPDIDEKSIRELVRHGLGMMGFFQTKHHDIVLNNNQEALYYYFGQVTNVPAKRLEISKRKHRKKIRLMHSLNKIPYSGYMYMAFNEEDNARHQAGENVPKAYLYKVLEEAKLYRKGKYFLQIKMENPHKWLLIQEDYETTGAEYIQ